MFHPVGDVHALKPYPILFPTRLLVGTVGGHSPGEEEEHVARLYVVSAVAGGQPLPFHLLYITAGIPAGCVPFPAGKDTPGGRRRADMLLRPYLVAHGAHREPQSASRLFSTMYLMGFMLQVYEYFFEKGSLGTFNVGDGAKNRARVPVPARGVARLRRHRP